MSANRFETSPAFKSALAAVTHVYRLTATLPPDEKSGLIGAMRKSVTGVPPLIAHLWEADEFDPAQKATDSAHALLRDCLAQAVIANHLGYLSRHQIADLRKRLAKVDFNIEALLDGLFEDFDDDPLSLADAA